MHVPPYLLPFLQRGTILVTSCLLSWTKEALPKWGLLLKGTICSSRSKFSPLRVDPYVEV